MKLIIWDLDCTLAYREGGKWSAPLLETIRQAAPDTSITVEEIRPILQQGFPWHTPHIPHPHLRQADDWWDAIRPSLIQCCDIAGVQPELTPAVVTAFREVYTDAAMWRVYPDAFAVLHQLRLGGWTHTILSNHVPELTEIIGRLGLLDYVDSVFNSADTGYEKPHPQAYRMVLDRYRDAERVWMVGDNYEADVAGPEEQGIPAILVRAQDPRARYVCSDLYDVLATLMRETAASAPTP